MIRFNCDYHEGAHPCIMEAPVQTVRQTSSVVRFCTSWATKEENVRKLLEDMK